MQYGNVYVDERYSAILAPNLTTDNTLIPGTTYNSEYQGDAGSGKVKIYVHNGDAAAEPTTPAGDFNHEALANSLIDLTLNNAYRKSKKIYKVTANSIAYDLAERTLANAVQDVARDRQASAYACLVNEGTVYSDTTATTAANLKAMITAVRKEARKKHAKPNVVFASVDVYSAMLEIAGDKYIPQTNETMWASGRVGQFLGMTWFECDGLEGKSVKYYDHAGTSKTVDLTGVEFAMYDAKAFNIVDNLEVMRIIDATDFVGSYAQVEVNTGFRVTNSNMVFVKKVASV